MSITCHKCVEIMMERTGVFFCSIECENKWADANQPEYDVDLILADEHYCGGELIECSPYDDMVCRDCGILTYPCDCSIHS